MKILKKVCALLFFAGALIGLWANGFEVKEFEYNMRDYTSKELDYAKPIINATKSDVIEAVQNDNVYCVIAVSMRAEDGNLVFNVGALQMRDGARKEIMKEIFLNDNNANSNMSRELQIACNTLTIAAERMFADYDSTILKEEYQYNGNWGRGLTSSIQELLPSKYVFWGDEVLEATDRALKSRELILKNKKTPSN